MNLNAGRKTLRNTAIRSVASGRRPHRATLLTVIIAAVLAAQPGLANARSAAQDKIENLVVCYALGTDAIGRAVDAVGGQPLDSTINLDDPNFAAGLALYRQCFANGFSFTLEFDGVAVLTVPDPATVTPTTDAALQWANFVNNAFRGPGYRNTQHHLGTITSSVAGKRGTSQAYLIATHAYGPTSARSGVSVVGGTYRDEVVLVGGRWLTQKRTLNITSSVNVPADL